MSEIIFNKGIAPAAPVAGKANLYVDLADGRIKSKDGDTGQTGTLSAVGLDRNYVINGGHFFAQRQTPGTLTTYSSTANRAYAADRWGITNENASVQYQRVDTLGGIETGLVARYYGRYKKITSAGKMVISQVVEGVSSASLRGDVVRVHAKMKRTVAAAMTVRLGLVQLQAAGTIDTIPATFISAFGAASTDPTLGTNLAYIPPLAGSQDGGTISGNALNCVLSSSWIRFSATFTVPLDCKNLVVMVWTDGQPAANDELNISEVGLYDAAEIKDWVELPLEQEYANAQRYYCKTFNVDIGPAQNVGLLSGEERVLSPVGASTAFPAGWTWEFPRPMRLQPTLTTYNPAAANAEVRNITLGTDCSATAVTASGQKRAVINSTTPASTVTGTNVLGIHISASAEL